MHRPGAPPTNTPWVGVRPECVGSPAPNPCLSSGVASPGARGDVGEDGIPRHPAAVVHPPGRGDCVLACSPEQGDSAVGGGANGGSPGTTTGGGAEAAAFPSGFRGEEGRTRTGHVTRGSTGKASGARTSVDQEQPLKTSLIPTASGCGSDLLQIVRSRIMTEIRTPGVVPSSLNSGLWGPGERDSSC